MKKFFQEFKAFAVKGNVIDLAVAVIIGGAFGKIVSSLVADVIMPPLGILVGGDSLPSKQWVLKQATEEKVAVVMNIGAFLQNVIDFLAIALVIFLMVKAISTLKEKIKGEDEKEKAAQPPVITKDQALLTEIRDLLKSQSGR